VGQKLKKIVNAQRMIVRLVVPKYKTKIKKPKIKLKEKITKPKVKLNCIGYPEDDPYGLAAAFWKIFTKPTEDKKNG
tara:strand:+ start:205 stop:435 length:231 start_codon:yes stop_codon:yes gene_type:complete